MPKNCKKCNEEFPHQMKIDGKIRNFRSRKYCLTCSPFGKHNTRSLEKTQSKKICGVCKIKKDVSEFYLKTDGYTYYYCKKCMNNKRNEYFRRNKEMAIEYKGGTCERCGYCKCPAALQFHHVDPNEKEFSLSQFRGANFENIKVELDKCMLLCANCHAEEHYAG